MITEQGPWAFIKGGVSPVGGLGDGCAHERDGVEKVTCGKSSFKEKKKWFRRAGGRRVEKQHTVRGVSVCAKKGRNEVAGMG